MTGKVTEFAKRNQVTQLGILMPGAVKFMVYMEPKIIVAHLAPKAIALLGGFAQFDPVWRA